MAIVTLATDQRWHCFAARVIIQGDLLAGNELSTGEWFQVSLSQCSVTFDPTQARAH
jgi:hypothetical protein